MGPLRCVRAISAGLTSLPRNVVHRRRYGGVVGPTAEVAKSFTDIDVATFLCETSQMTRPLLLRKPVASSADFPASTKWFGELGPDGRPSLAPYMTQFADAVLPYELMVPQTALPAFQDWLLSRDRDPWSPLLAKLLSANIPAAPEQVRSPSVPQPRRFLSFQAPLALLISSLAFNSQAPPASGNHNALRELYIAQAPLPDLPPALSADLPAPELVRAAGRGDVYGSSVWLGLEPTYTPLHRDPNPNLLCQLRGRKAVRLVPPRVGDALFAEVQRRLQGESGGRTGGSSRIRTSEMMEGRERELMHEAVWGTAGEDAQGTEMVEASLGPGDAFFIPLGWWHSVKSESADGRLNASVNWWFR